jgi:hypothetical protein
MAAPPHKNATVADGAQTTATAVGLAYHDEMPLGFRQLERLESKLNVIM